MTVRVRNVGLKLFNATTAKKHYFIAILRIHTIRKPYTEIGGTDCYSGRTYDEAHITAFIYQPAPTAM